MDQRRSMNSSRRNIQEILLGHIISRLLKTSDKEKTLEAARRGQKDTVYAEEQISITADFLLEIKQLRQQKSNTFTIKTKPNPVSLEFYTKNIFQNEDKDFLDK